MAGKTNDLLSHYVDSAEQQKMEQSTPIIQAQPVFPGAQPNVEAQQNSGPYEVQIPISEMKGLRRNPVAAAEEAKARRTQMGYHEIDVKTLPTGGMFYDPEMKISIRAAKGDEIKHWSTMNDEEIESVNAAWNYMIESCVRVVCPRNGGNWRDLSEIDRLYLLLAIREITFTDDDNNLTVHVSDTKDIPVSKEMIHYIDIPADIMKLYDPAQRCFVLRFKNGNVINLHIPCFGVQEWLSTFGIRKSNEGVKVDMDNLQYAQMLIGDYRGLTDEEYNKLCYTMNTWSVQEWSVISYVFDSLRKTLVPMIKYTREDGVEESVPVSFRGGVKSIFTIQNPLSLLC